MRSICKLKPWLNEDITRFNYLLVGQSSAHLLCGRTGRSLDCLINACEELSIYRTLKLIKHPVIAIVLWSISSDTVNNASREIPNKIRYSNQVVSIKKMTNNWLHPLDRLPSWEIYYMESWRLAHGHIGSIGTTNYGSKIKVKHWGLLVNYIGCPSKV